MSILKAVILGIVQGLSEFLPISSSGHLAIARELLKMDTEAGLFFDVLLHIGTLAAIFIVFWKDIKMLMIEGLCLIRDIFINFARLVLNLFSRNNKKEYVKIAGTSYRRFVICIIISTIPTGIIGVLFEKLILKSYSGLLLPGICLLITAVLLFLADRVKEGSITEENTSYPKAVIVGIVQGLATLPGISRSGSTITAGLYCGFTREYAVRYSFIMSIPAILGAAVLEVKDIFEITLTASDVAGYILGTIAAALVGLFAIKVMLKAVKTKKFKWFSVYCAAVGLVAVISSFIIK